MNLLRIVAETWYRLIQVAKQDQVKDADILHISFQFADEIIDGVGVSDLLDFGFSFDETVTVSEALAIVMTWVITESETVTVSDSLAVDMGIALSDEVTVYDSLDSVIGHGFGLGGFGTSPFGSLSFLDSNPQDFIAATDELVAAMSMVLSDTVTVTDDLIFSSGFGAPWAAGDDGFGETPFGS